MQSRNDDYDLLTRIVIIGDSTVGKSSLMMRFVDGNFEDAFTTTIGVDFRVRVITVDGIRTKMQIWDTAGQERFRAITRSYYRGAMGIIILYDVTNKESFLNVDKWLQQVAEYGSPRVRIILVSTKCDLERERQVSYEDGYQKAEGHVIKFVETSARNATNLETAFNNLVSEILVEYSSDIQKRDPSKDKGKALKPGENELVKYATCC